MAGRWRRQKDGISAATVEGLRALVIGRGQKVNRRLDSHSHRNDRVRHVASPHPIGRCAHATPGPDPRGPHLGENGPKAPTGKKGYRLKTPRRPIKV
jgi:hypothetical protein